MARHAVVDLGGGWRSATVGERRVLWLEAELFGPLEEALLSHPSGHHPKLVPREVATVA
jgi:hypothetical protein